MKNLLATLALILLALYCAGNLNYLGACKQAANSEGTDSAISEIMTARGFTCDIFDEPTETEKIISLFKSL